jgi:hypothetical protein
VASREFARRRRCRRFRHAAAGRAAELMPVFTDGRLRPRLRPSATARPAAVLVLLFRTRGRAPDRPDRAAELRRPPQRRGQLPGRQGRARRRRSRPRPRSARPPRRSASTRSGRASASSARSARSSSRSATSGSRRSSRVAGRAPSPDPERAEVAGSSTPRSTPSCRRPDRDRRADDRRLAAPLRRLPDRRAPRLGRDGPDPRPARCGAGSEA